MLSEGSVTTVHIGNEDTVPCKIYIYA